MRVTTAASPGGAAIGLAFGVATRLVLKWMHRRGHKAPEQLALTVAVPFLSFYVANGPCARANLSVIAGARFPCTCQAIASVCCQSINPGLHEAPWAGPDVSGT